MEQSLVPLGVVTAGLGVAIELVGVGLYVGSRGTVAVSGEAVTTTPLRGRVVLTLSPAQLTQPFHAGYTDVQARNMTKQYLGKLLKITGPLNDVRGPSGGNMLVSLDRIAVGERYVSMWFRRRRWQARLEAMSPGTSLTVVGKIREVNKYDVVLGKCRLVTE